MVLRVLVNTLIATAVFIGGYVAAAVAEHGNSPAMYCPYGQAEDDCQPDFRGKGKWVLTP